MIKRIDKNTARGTWFTVFIPDIHTIRYSEGGRVANIEIEGGRVSPGAPVTMTVYGQTLVDWLPPHEKDEMDVAKRDDILENVSKSLTVLEIPHEIVFS
jgi:hypothetical protein